MNISRNFALMASVAITMVVVPCFAQDAVPSGQAAPNVSGTGNAGRIALWKNSSTLGNSVISQSGAPPESITEAIFGTDQ
jgi:hypothetical protein